MVQLPAARASFSVTFRYLGYYTMTAFENERSHPVLKLHLEQYSHILYQGPGTGLIPVEAAGKHVVGM